MCCFSRPVEEVNNTRIFARLGAKGNQVLIYQMALHATEDLAMVLPIPVAKGASEDAVRFFDLSKYPLLFADMHRLFPEFKMARAAGDPFSSMPASGDSVKLQVQSVGAYDASFVPRIADFSRLDERFQLPRDVWDQVPSYESFGFAVFKLKPVRGAVHPMAFAFPTATPNRLFFPTLHIHDGQVHDKELFDHTLYFQATHGPLHGGWEESPGLPVTKVKCGLTHGMIRPDMHLYRHQMIGKFANGDVVVDLPAA
jgi:hypothetical protein